MNRIFRLFFLFCLSQSLLACKGGEGPMMPNCEFDQTVLLRHTAENLILPRYQAYQSACHTFKIKVDTFVNSPNEAHFSELITYFYPLYEAWQSVSMFAFGPATDLGFSLQERSNTFPTNTSGVDEAIAQQDFDIDNNFKSVVGIPAIEYLIFVSRNSSNGSRLAYFTTEPLAAERGMYLSLLTADLLEKATTVREAWEGSYQASFVANTGSADGSSLSLLVNQLNFDFETLKNFKFKIPLGKLNGGTPQPEQVESLFADHSLPLARIQAQAMLDLYLGKSANTQATPGNGSLDAYLRCLGIGADTPDGLLAEAIEDQFRAIILLLKNLPHSLYQSLSQSNQLDPIDKTYTEMQKLVPLLKREMTAALGVKISYIDNDGD